MGNIICGDNGDASSVDGSSSPRRRSYTALSKERKEANRNLKIEDMRRKRAERREVCDAMAVRRLSLIAALDVGLHEFFVECCGSNLSLRLIDAWEVAHGRSGDAHYIYDIMCFAAAIMDIRRVEYEIVQTRVHVGLFIPVGAINERIRKVQAASYDDGISRKVAHVNAHVVRFCMGILAAEFITFDKKHGFLFRNIMGDGEFVEHLKLFDKGAGCEVIGLVTKNVIK